MSPVLASVVARAADHHLVDALAVHVHHFEGERPGGETLAFVGQAVETVDDESGERLERLAFVLDDFLKFRQVADQLIHFHQTVHDPCVRAGCAQHGAVLPRFARA